MNEGNRHELLARGPLAEPNESDSVTSLTPNRLYELYERFQQEKALTTSQLAGAQVFLYFLKRHLND